MVLGAIIGGALSIGTSLLGGSKERSNQRTAEANAKKLVKWENDTSLLNWKYTNEVRDFEFNEQLRIYGKSTDIYNRTLDFNAQAEGRSYAAETRKLDEYLQGMAFDKQSAFVELMKNQGAVQNFGGAGNSSARLARSVLSDWGRNNAMMAENLVSAVSQHKVDNQNIGLQRQGADLDALSRLGLAPIQAPKAPKPKKKPTAGGTSVNSALSIGNSLLSGLSTFNSMGGFR